MLVAKFRRVGGRRFRREYEEFARVAQSVLADIRAAIGADDEVPIGEDHIGVKAWVLPPWYFRRLIAQRRGLICWVEYSANTFRHPTMVSIGYLDCDHILSTGRPWSIGKGVIGRTVFQDSPETGKEQCNLFFHARDIGRHDQLPRRKFYRLPGEVRMQLSRRDMRILKDTYGTTIACGVRLGPSQPPFGCVTVDTPKDTVLTQDEALRCGDIMAGFVPDLVQKLLDAGFPVVTTPALEERFHDATMQS